MRARGTPGTAATLALAACLCASGAACPVRAEAAIGQSILIDAEEKACARLLRADGPINSGNVLGLPEWTASFSAEAEWTVDFDKRVHVDLYPLVAWREAGGAIEGWAFVPAESQRGEAEISLPIAEARLSLPEIGIEAIFGKLRPEVGANYIEPLSATKPQGRARPSEGKWMAGLFLSLGDASLEAYCEAARDPFAVAWLSVLAGGHEAGLVYRRDLGNSLGAWWRGQFGDGIIAYAEASIRENGDSLDIEGLPARDIGPNGDALAGLGLTPADLGISLYLEYRYRGSGYSSEDYERLAALPVPLRGFALAGLPFTQTARHSIGLYAMSDTEGDARVSWSATCLYYLPDGLDLAAEVEARVVGRCRAFARLEAAVPIAGALEAASEAAFRPDELGCSVGLRWRVDAGEGE